MLLRMIGQNLRGRPLRSALTMTGVAVAVASFVALVSLARGTANAWRSSMDETGAHILAFERGVVDVFTSALPLDLGGRLAAVPGVAVVGPQLSKLVPAERESHQVVLNGLPNDSATWQGIPLIRGRLPAVGETWVAVLGANLAEALGKDVGDEIQLLWRPFRVIGIARYRSLMNNSAILTPLAALQQLAHNETTATFFTIRLVEPLDRARVAAIIAELSQREPSVLFAETAGLAEDNRFMRLLQAIAWAVSTIALGMGLLVVTNTLVMAVTERTREIGTLAALGWERARIMRLVILEGLLLAFAGSAAGTALGIAVAELLAGLPVVEAFLEPTYGARIAIEVAVATLVIGSIGALYPAWQATRVPPVSALQHE